MKELKVFTAFSGYDSQCLALDKVKGLTYELVGWSDIDKSAINAHNALYPQYSDRNYNDISKINWDEVPDFDLFTYSSPCQDWSQGGFMKGGSKDSGTRSSLLWECQRAIEAKMPKYLLMENVKMLVGKKFIGVFNEWLEYLSSLGYKSKWKVLNAKHYGMPHNRERLFVVSVLGEDNDFEFPEPLTDVKSIEELVQTDNIPEKYFLSDDKIKTLIEQERPEQPKEGKISFDDSSELEETRQFIRPLGWSRDDYGHVKDRYLKNEINCLTGFASSGLLTTSVFFAIYNHNKSNISPFTKHERLSDLVKQNIPFKVRIITPKDGFKFMGLTDEQADAIINYGRDENGNVVDKDKVISEKGLNMLSANSIVVDVIYRIFEKMFEE